MIQFPPMSRRIEIRPVVVQGGKVGLLSGLAEEVAREMRAEGRAGVAFDRAALRFVSQGEAQVEVDYDYPGRNFSAGVEDAVRAAGGREVAEAESRYGLKLRRLREEQVVANAEKHDYAVEERVEESGKVKLLLVRRVPE